MVSLRILPRACSFFIIVISDEDLDQQKMEEAEALQILHFLAHRGDGDWSRHYHSGEIGLEHLQAARKHPDAKVIERALGELALTSVKGKGKAQPIGSPDRGGHTIYTGASDFSNFLQIQLIVLIDYDWEAFSGAVYQAG